MNRLLESVEAEVHALRNQQTIVRDRLNDKEGARCRLNKMTKSAPPTQPESKIAPTHQFGYELLLSDVSRAYCGYDNSYFESFSDDDPTVVEEAIHEAALAREKVLSLGHKRDMMHWPAQVSSIEQQYEGAAMNHSQANGGSTPEGCKNTSNSRLESKFVDHLRESHRRSYQDRFKYIREDFSKGDQFAQQFDLRPGDFGIDTASESCDVQVRVDGHQEYAPKKKIGISIDPRCTKLLSHSVLPSSGPQKGAELAQTNLKNGKIPSLPGEDPLVVLKNALSLVEQPIEPALHFPSLDSAEEEA